MISAIEKGVQRLARVFQVKRRHSNSLLLRLRKYTWALAALWSVIVFLMCLYGISGIKETTLGLAKKEATSHLNKDWATRLWAASRGGVYVPVTGHTLPNPYLADVPERDITTPGGRRLTLMNSAYMLRTMMEHYSGLYGIRSHITSLDHFRNETAPDEWEKAALGAFERGEREFCDISEIEGRPHLRLMKPLLTEPDCLKCHHSNKVGDIRGGTSVSVPLAPYLSSQKQEIFKLTASFAALWLIGMAGIAFFGTRFRRRVKETQESEESLRKAEAALKAHAKKLEQKNQELEVFSSIISHDLQHPLQKILTFADRVENMEPNALSDKRCDYLMRLRQSAERMQELIIDLLEYSRVTSKAAPLTRINLKVPAMEAVSDLSMLFDQSEGRIEVRDLPDIEADPVQMRQLFQNLIANALKYRGEEKPFVSIRCEPSGEGESVDILVRDNGIGFDERDLDKIFMPFQRLHGRNSPYPGTGMGLAICHKIAGRHGGNITAHSAPGKGSTFVVTLPVRQ